MLPEMAEDDSTASVSKAIAKLEQQLTCSVCLDRYKHPKTLPCLHSFCRDCLDRFPVLVKNGDHFITCPMCRQATQQPDSGFMSAFLINNLLELHHFLKKLSGSQQNSCDNCHKEQAVEYCKPCSKLLCRVCLDRHNGWADFIDHKIVSLKDVAASASELVPVKDQPSIECAVHGEPLKVYCDTCDKPVCHLCTAAKAHRNHDYEPFADAFPRHRQQIIDNLQQVKDKLADIVIAMQPLECQEREFLEQVKTAKEEIKATVQQLIQLLKESERDLTKELDQISDSYVKKLSAHKKEAEIIAAQLKSCETFAEDELRIGSQQEILVMKSQMVERMKTICSQAKTDDIQKLEDTKIKFVRSARVLEACHNLGCVIRLGQVKVSDIKASFELCRANLSSEAIFSQLSSIDDLALVVKCAVHEVSPASYEVHFPPTPGHYLMTLHLGEANILDSPYAIEIKQRKPESTFAFLSSSRGVAVTKEGQLIVADYGNRCIAVVNATNGDKIDTYRQESFKYPEGVAVTQDGHIVVTDFDNHCLHVLTADGSYLSTVGSKGSQPLQFESPYDVAVHSNGRIFVTDNNNRVQVLNADLSYSHCFGSKGTQPGEFHLPCGITVDSAGMIYVADVLNKRVQKFTPEGMLLAVIDSREKRAGPWGLCVDSNDILYVTEYYSNTVCMFSAKGQFLGYLGDSDGSNFKQPRFIVSDKKSKLYVSDDSGVVTF